MDVGYETRETTNDRQEQSLSSKHVKECDVGAIANTICNHSCDTNWIWKDIIESRRYGVPTIRGY